MTREEVVDACRAARLITDAVARGELEVTLPTKPAGCLAIHQAKSWEAWRQAAAANIALADRVAICSELLSRRAERRPVAPVPVVLSETDHYPEG